MIDPEKEKLLRMPTIRQGIVNNNYFTFKDVTRRYFFPQKRLSIKHTELSLKKKLLTTPNMSQGIIKSHSPTQEATKKVASFLKESLLRLKKFLCPIIT